MRRISQASIFNRHAVLFFTLSLLVPFRVIGADKEIQMTCVFQSGNRIVAVYYGQAWAFLKGFAATPNADMIGQLVTVYPQPFRDCSNEAGQGLIPVGKRSLKIEHITYRDANPTATTVEGELSQIAQPSPPHPLPPIQSDPEQTWRIKHAGFQYIGHEYRSARGGLANEQVFEMVPFQFTVADNFIVDESYWQPANAIANLVGGGAQSDLQKGLVRMPNGILIEVTGGYFWSVDKPSLTLSKDGRNGIFRLQMYCGPNHGIGGEGCNVDVRVWVKIKPIQ